MATLPAARRAALVSEARRAQAIDDDVDAMRDADDLPFDCERRALPVVAEWDKATGALLALLAPWETAPLRHHGLSFLADELRALQERIRAASRDLARVPKADRGRPRSWRRQIERELTRSGLSRSEARKLLRPDALRGIRR